MGDQLRPQTAWAEGDRQWAQPPGGAELINQSWDHLQHVRSGPCPGAGEHAVPKKGPPPIGVQWSKTAPRSGSSRFENGWAGGPAGVKPGLPGRGGGVSKDALESSIVEVWTRLHWL